MQKDLKSSSHVLLSFLLGFLFFSIFVSPKLEEHSSQNSLIHRSNPFSWIQNFTKEEQCLLYPVTEKSICFDLYLDVLSPEPKCHNSSSCPLEIATQLSMDRLSLLLGLIRTWDGTISASIFITDFDRQIPSLFHKISALGCEIYDRLRIHLVVGKPTDPYPINFLRNIALENGRKNDAPLVGIYDIDFIPSPSLCKKIMFWNSVHSLESLSNKLVSTPPVLPPIDKDCHRTIDLPDFVVPKQQHRFMFILPSFEVNAETKGAWKYSVPSSKERLRVWYTSGDVTRFHYPFVGQEMDLPKWFFIEEPFFQSPSRMNNEHYAWFSWKQYRKVSNEKVCDENFFDRGTNKIACYLQLRVSGFVPAVIPDGWLIHKDSTQFTPLQHRKASQVYFNIFSASFCSKIRPFGWIEKLERCQFCNKEPKGPKNKISPEKKLCYAAITYSQGISPPYNPSQLCTQKMQYDRWKSEEGRGGQ